MSTQSRKPKGTPVGGQFAAKSKTEASLTLSNEPDFGTQYGSTPAYVLPDGRKVTMWRKGQKVRFYDATGNQIGPEQANVGPAAAFAYSQGWVSPHTADAHNHSLTREWAKVGVTDEIAIERMDKRGIVPGHYISPDRDVRMAAHAAAGDLIFEGELLSNASELWRHEPSLDKDRVFHHPAEVYVGGHQVRWSSLSATDQLAYIKGYASAIANDGAQLARPRVPWTDPEGDGYVRGANAVSAARVIAEHPNEDRGFRIVDPDAVGRVLTVTHAKPAQQRGGYVAQVGKGQKRRHHTDTGSQDVPWAEGAKVFFKADALGV